MGLPRLSRIVALGSLGAACLVLAPALVSPDVADACQPDGPCTTSSELIDCSGAGSGFANFNVPKDARNLRYKIKDAASGEVYSAANSICPPATTSTSDQLIPGATEDTYKVSYSITAGGSGQKNIRITAEWDRESDLGVSKTLVGGGDTLDAESATTFAITVHNYGPAPTDGFFLDDSWTGNGSPLTIKEVRQVEGPKALSPPTVVDGVKVKGKWGQLQPGDEVTILVTVVVKYSTIVGNGADAYHDTTSAFPSYRVEPGTDTHPNAVGKTFYVRPVPDSKIKSAGAGGASGSATPSPTPEVMSAGALAGPSASTVKRVQVAVLRLGGGRPFSQLPANPTKKPGKCKWLKRSGGFKGRKPRKKVCDSPVWISAQGAKHWHIAFHGLPPGRYMLYSRAVGTDGAAEGNFSAKDKNRRRFSVR